MPETTLASYREAVLSVYVPALVTAVFNGDPDYLALQKARNHALGLLKALDNALADAA